LDAATELEHGSNDGSSTKEQRDEALCGATEQQLQPGRERVSVLDVRSCSRQEETLGSRGATAEAIRRR
jgi:hypothetical protein